MRNLRSGVTSCSLAMGIHYYEAVTDSGDPLFFGIWNQSSWASRLHSLQNYWSLLQELSDPTGLFYDAEALEEKRTEIRDDGNCIKSKE